MPENDNAHEECEVSDKDCNRIKRDAKIRALRTAWQGVAVVALIGAATAVQQMVISGHLLTLRTIVTAATTGALMSVAAWVHRRWEAKVGKA